MSYGTHACGIFAAAMAFFGFLSLFPLLLLLISLFSLLLKTPDAVSLILSYVAVFLPGSPELVSGVIDSISQAEPFVFSIGALGLLWSSMGVFVTMGYAFNRVWDLPGNRHIAIQYLIAAGLALSVGLVVVVSLLLAAASDAVLLMGESLGLRIPGIGPLTVLASNVIDLGVLAGAAAVLYRALPQTRVRWRHAIGPAVFVAVIGGLAKLGFTWYLSAIARVGRIYGPIAAVAGLMLWLFVAAVLLLFGAELSHQASAERTTRSGKATPEQRNQCSSLKEG